MDVILGLPLDSSEKKNPENNFEQNIKLCSIVYLLTMSGWLWRENLHWSSWDMLNGKNVGNSS